MTIRTFGRALALAAALAAAGTGGTQANCGDGYEQCIDAAYASYRHCLAQAQHWGEVLACVGLYQWRLQACNLAYLACHFGRHDLDKGSPAQ